MNKAKKSISYEKNRENFLRKLTFISDEYGDIMRNLKTYENNMKEKVRLQNKIHQNCIHPR